MKLFTLLALGSALIATTVAVGLVHGRWTNRWGERPDILSASVRLEKLPLKVGDWESKGNIPLDPETVRILQCSGSVNRIYEHAKTGERVSVAVLLGPFGPISVHTPEICYSSQNYHIAQERSRWAASESAESEDEFWDVSMQGNDVSSAPFRVLYGWTNDKTWHAAQNPRFSYGGSPFLYKLQLAAPMTAEGQQHDVCRDFLTEFLPVLRQYLIDPQ